MAFQYRARSADQWSKRASQQGGDFVSFVSSDFKMFAPAKGDNYVRILPPSWDNADHYGLDVYVHYNIGDRGSALCLQKMFGKPCPMCQEQMRAQRANDEELAKELKAGKRVLVWVLNRKAEQDGPMVWAMPWTLDRDIAKCGRDPDTGEVLNIDDPENGYDISFERTGEGITTKYSGIRPSRRTSSVSQEFIDWIEEFPLPTVLIEMDAEEMMELYNGGPAPQEETPPARQATQRVAAAREAPQQQATNRSRPAQAARQPDPEPDPDPGYAPDDPGYDPDYGAEEPPPPDPEPEPPPRSRPQARPAPAAARQPTPQQRPTPAKAAPAKEPPPPANSGQSRAAALREKFGRK
jgi:hypothetical protein